MSTLTYGNSTFAPAAPEAAKAQRKPLWRRIVDAFMSPSSAGQTGRSLAFWPATAGS